ncbi:hypothetical protein [Saccharothrix australiensis]|uniref:hypothetical protein n=1 Tax=Saccharothrix australiensis TaxID=2072 RepID=UPI001FE54CFF|nr:hypothetical protein [Saccharothrix australiensis]
MSAHLLTVSECAEIGEIESGCSESREGRVLTSPSPTTEHDLASLEPAVPLRAQRAAELLVTRPSTWTWSRRARVGPTTS